MVDPVSISFVRSLNLSPCKKRKHQHVVPVLEGVGETRPKTYGFYHLRLTITDRFNRCFTFIHPFLAVDRNPSDSQVLLGRPALKDFQINIYNSDDSWEFEFQRSPKVTKISLQMPPPLSSPISTVLYVDLLTSSVLYISTIFSSFPDPSKSIFSI